MVEVLLRPSMIAPHLFCAANTTGFEVLPPRSIVTTMLPPLYTPFRTTTQSPGFTTSAACWMVWNAWALSPALPSLPDTASTQYHTPPPVGAQLADGPGAETATDAVPLFPSLVAVIAADPAATPITSPLVVTVATEGLLVAHVMVRPERGLPLASFGVAVSWIVPPARIDAAAGLTLTDATAAGVTVTAAVSALPSLVAITLAEPTATPVTNPVPLTVATDVLVLAHVMVRPVSVLPFASRSVALSCAVRPTTTEADAGLRVTEATGSAAEVTVTTAVSALPSLVAITLAEPAATPVTNPVPLTVATDVLVLAHVMVRPVTVLPFASRRVALSCAVRPTTTEADAGLIVTEATGRTVVLTAKVPLPVTPSLVAVIEAVPAARAVASPLPSTLATDVLELDQEITRPPSAVPLASSGTATNWIVPPMAAPAFAGMTTTEAIGEFVDVTTTPALSDFPLDGSFAITVKLPGCPPALKCPLCMPLPLTTVESIMVPPVALQSTATATVSLASVIPKT